MSTVNQQIIHVTGVSGCGKTYLKHMLKLKKGFVFKDVDDFWVMAMKDAVRNNKKYTDNYEKARMNFHIRKYIKDNKNNHIIFSGFHEVPSYDRMMYVKIAKSDMKNVYRRKIIRDFEKLVKHNKLIKSEINKRDKTNLHLTFFIVTHGPVGIKVSYEIFVQNYEKDIDYCENLEKCSVLSQKQIAAKINDFIAKTPLVQ